MADTRSFSADTIDSLVCKEGPLIYRRPIVHKSAGFSGSYPKYLSNAFLFSKLHFHEHLPMSPTEVTELEKKFECEVF